ncbi:hypothetical protein JCM39194_03920 [Desulfotomaculum varum]
MISLCMIVKNEEHNLARCLNSVKNCVDEIIIVDTGSTDGTLNIARQYGAKIFHYQWDEDFAAARNYSLEQAGGEWILYLDADEELEPNGCERLRSLAADTQYEAYFFQIINLTDNNAPLKHINVRMFRNKPQYRFTGKLHEQIISAIPPRSDRPPVVNSGLCIIHYGYLAREFLAKNKAVRNHRINQRLVEEEPDNPFYLYSLGGSCVNLNDLTGAIAHYRKALQYVNLRAMYAPSIFISLISCLSKTGQLAAAADYIEQGKTNYPDYVDIHYVEGEFYHRLGHLKRAVACYEKCLQLGEQLSGKYTSRTGVGSFLPCFKLAEIYQQEGRLKEALAYQIAGLKHQPADINQYIALARLLQQVAGSRQQLYEILKENIKHKDQAARRLLLARIFYEIAEYEQALALFNELPDDRQETAYYKALTCIKSGRRAAARQSMCYIRQPHLYENVLAELLPACWTAVPPEDVLPYLEHDTMLAPEHRSILININHLLLDWPHASEINLHNYYVSQTVNQLLAQKAFSAVDKILNQGGLTAAADKINYLMQDDSNPCRVEMASRLALAAIKKGSVQPDWLFVLSKYFYHNNQLATAQATLLQAMRLQPRNGRYQQLLISIYSRQTLQMVQTALRHYPANPQFNRWLIELHEFLNLDAGLKGVH